MTRAQLLKLVAAANCKVIGAEHVRYIGERQTLAALATAFNNSESHLLCEPSLARRKNRRPDIVLIDVEIGVCVFEVKGLSLDRIAKIQAGGVLHFRYGNGTRIDKPITQVCNAMFDIKDTTRLAFNGDIRVRFEYRVVFPAIRRDAWHQRFGAHCFCPPEFLFADDLDSTALARSLGATDRVSSNSTIRLCPLDQLQCVWRAFGDTSVLYWEPDQRVTRLTESGTLGRQFDEAAEAYKELSEDQQRLSAMDWQQGPRLVRGVAGSGKTVVLANNLARRLERRLRDDEEILTGMKPAKPRLLAVCFNRTLAPLIRKKIEIAFQQRTGKPLPAGSVEVCSFNTLMYRLMRAGLWTYQSVRNAAEIVLALNYLEQIDGVRQNDPLRLQRLAGRAQFYVGCTRAIEYLEVFSQTNTGLPAEFAAALRAC